MSAGPGDAAIAIFKRMYRNKPEMGQGSFDNGVRFGLGNSSLIRHSDFKIRH